MSKKSAFIEMMNEMVQIVSKEFNPEETFPEGWDYWVNEVLKNKDKGALTDNGRMILDAMQKSISEGTSSEIGEAASIGAKSVSGSMRKLIEMGFVERVPDSKPVRYKLTDAGAAQEIS